MLTSKLAVNGDRVLALKERGHRSYALQTPEPQSLNIVGALPFIHVAALPGED